jgi:hypothetical protein
MLNKKLKFTKKYCIECYKKHNFEWSNNDETRWNKGILECTEITSEEEFNQPPKNCPYRIEHLLNWSE